MVPWTYLREPLCGKRYTDLTSELTLLINLVIHLRKRKQSAFFRVSHRPSRFLNNGPPIPGITFLLKLYRWLQKPPSFSTLLGRLTAVNAMHMRQRRRPCFQVWYYFPFGYLGEVKPVVHQIREDSHSRYMPPGG